MKEFTTSAHCHSRAHCVECRSNPAWRASVGAPEHCPHGVTISAPVPNPVQGNRSATTIKTRGAELWRALHNYALNYPDQTTPEDMRLARAWLDWFNGQVARLTGCACHSDWHVMLKVCPPAIHTRQSFYLWTVAAHDRINRRLNKPLHSPEWSSAHPLLTTA